jgi:hypothetical protein
LPINSSVQAARQREQLTDQVGKKRKVVIRMTKKRGKKEEREIERRMYPEVTEDI